MDSSLKPPMGAFCWGNGEPSASVPASVDSSQGEPEKSSKNGLKLLRRFEVLSK
jgi:hypothetical protein